MAYDYDAIIIGGGHNGLVTAALLAQAGQAVLVLERRPVLGGGAATEMVFPGCQINTGAVDAGMFRPEIVEALQLKQYGLEFIESAVTAFAPQPDGSALTLWRDVEKSQADIAHFSEADAESFPAFIQQVSYCQQLLDGLMLHTPPDFSAGQLEQVIPWFAERFQIDRLGSREFTDFMRVLPLSAAEFLGEWFESAPLRGALGAASISGNMQGPHAPWAAFHLLYHYLGAANTGFRASRFVKGGIGQLAAALAQAAQVHGATVQTDAAVNQIIVQNDRAESVVLNDGQTLSAPLIVSNLDARQTFFGLVGAPQFTPSFVRRVKNIRYRGCTTRINLVLSDLPQFRDLDVSAEQLGGHILINADLETIERAYDDAKYGRISAKPYFDIVIPTVHDPDLAPAGQHLMAITMQYTPYHLQDTSWATERDRLADTAVAILGETMPNLPDLILHRQIITPLEWETEYGLSEGSIYHGQMGLDQIWFMRPVAGYGQYRTPIENLYLCGAGTHPGGGVTGASGYNAAREILRDLGFGGANHAPRS